MSAAHDQRPLDLCTDWTWQYFLFFFLSFSFFPLSLPLSLKTWEDSCINFKYGWAFFSSSSYHVSDSLRLYRMCSSKCLSVEEVPESSMLWPSTSSGLKTRSHFTLLCSCSSTLMFFVLRTRAKIRWFPLIVLSHKRKRTCFCIMVLLFQWKT